MSRCRPGEQALLSDGGDSNAPLPSLFDSIPPWYAGEPFELLEDGRTGAALHDATVYHCGGITYFHAAPFLGHPIILTYHLVLNGGGGIPLNICSERLS